MSSSFENYFDNQGNVKEDLLQDNPWLRYLTETDNVYVNAERLESISSLTGKETLMYVFKTLDLLEEVTKRDLLTSEEKDIIEKTLKWSEVAKGGTSCQRDTWSGDNSCGSRPRRRGPPRCRQTRCLGTGTGSRYPH